MLRLCRLARLIRALHFEILDELKQMIAGVFDGMNVLFWAIVLLFFCMFFIGLAMRIFVGEVEPECRSGGWWGYCDDGVHSEESDGADKSGNDLGMFYEADAVENNPGSARG